MKGSLTVHAHCHGQRLDKVLAELVPDASLRARRRLCEEGQVLVNGRLRAAGHPVREGDDIVLREPEAQTTSFASPTGDSPRWLESHDGLHFFHKPAGLHSTALAGSSAPSLEALLPTLLGAHEPATLLNRLDCPTSGIMLAATSAEAAARCRCDEGAGQVYKHYLALLCGHMPEALTVTRALDTAQRKITRVLWEDAPRLRHTSITPLAHCAALPELGIFVPATLALCVIRKGARHQIRAHAAHAGFPLCGDGRYTKPTGEQENFFLHHGLLQMPHFSVIAPCPWLPFLPQEAQKIANDITAKPGITISCPIPCPDLAPAL